MKLSEKGFQEVRKICWESSHNCLKIAENLNQFDFKQEHFKDCVVLTVKEAKILLKLIKYKQFFTENEVVEIVKLTQRIKQAEDK